MATHDFRNLKLKQNKDQHEQIVVHIILSTIVASEKVLLQYLQHHRTTRGATVDLISPHLKQKLGRGIMGIMELTEVS